MKRAFINTFLVLVLFVPVFAESTAAFQLASLDAGRVLKARGAWIIDVTVLSQNLII
jgi:hypothetical protein